MTQEQITEAVTAREKEWMQAWIMKDENAFHNILADDFLLSSARGRYMNKQEWISGAMGAFTCESFDWEEINVRSYGNTAVVNAIAKQQAKVGEEDWSGRFLITDVWVLQNGNWQVVARHGTGPLPG
jgi:ketosteroid isomerase-like protein